MAPIPTGCCGCSTRWGHQALGVNLDPSHTFPVGELPDVTIYRLNKHVLHCDFSDNDGTTNVHWRPGKGKIDWERALRALKESRLRRGDLARVRGRAGGVARRA